MVLLISHSEINITSTLFSLDILPIYFFCYKKSCTIQYIILKNFCSAFLHFYHSLSFFCSLIFLFLTLVQFSFLEQKPDIDPIIDRLSSNKRCRVIKVHHQIHHHLLHLYLRFAFRWSTGLLVVRVEHGGFGFFGLLSWQT